MQLADLVRFNKVEIISGVLQLFYCSCSLQLYCKCYTGIVLLQLYCYCTAIVGLKLLVLRP